MGHFPRSLRLVHQFYGLLDRFKTTKQFTAEQDLGSFNIWSVWEGGGLPFSTGGDRESWSRKGGAWLRGNVKWPRRRLQEIASALEHMEWAKSMDIATMT